VSALYGWLRRHPKLVDGGLAAVLAFLGVASAAVMIFHPGSSAVGLTRAVGIPLALLLAVPVVFRRSHPVGAFAAAIVIGALQVLLNVKPNATDLAIVILLYTLAAYTPRRISVTGLVICLVGSATAVARWMPGQLGVLDAIAVGSIMFAGPSLIAWVFGDSMRYRRAYYASLEDRAARLEAERDAQAQVAAAAERARIARELHDVVAHNVSVMVVQADGASYALGSDPDRARQALAAIASTGRQALTEMRRMLGVLRRDEDGTEPERAPLPGIGQLGELLEQTRATGLAISFTVEGVPQPLPDGAALAAYRIVQESLTNTRKHGGPRATAQVTLRYLEDALLLRITDDGRGGAAASDGAGHGLTGMRERVAIYGGWVQAGPRPAGGYQVTARLPLTLAAPTAAPASPTLTRPAPASPVRREVLADTKRAGAA
jgi:signal transduction histidine kinase